MRYKNDKIVITTTFNFITLFSPFWVYTAILDFSHNSEGEKLELGDIKSEL